MGGGEERSAVSPSGLIILQGLSFCRNYAGYMSQSTRAHRLSRKAYLLGGQRFQLPVLCGLFKAHLEESKDIADFDVLADIAERVGMMSRQEALDFLHSDELEQEVLDLMDEAKKKGVTGVPFVIIDGKWAVEGGQSSEVFIQVGPCKFFFFFSYMLTPLCRSSRSWKNLRLESYLPLWIPTLLASQSADCCVDVFSVPYIIHLHACCFTILCIGPFLPQLACSYSADHVIMISQRFL